MVYRRRAIKRRRVVRRKRRTFGRKSASIKGITISGYGDYFVDKPKKPRKKTVIKNVVGHRYNGGYYKSNGGGGGGGRGGGSYGGGAIIPYTPPAEPWWNWLLDGLWKTVEVLGPAAVGIAAAVFAPEIIAFLTEVGVMIGWESVGTWIAGLSPTIINALPGVVKNALTGLKGGLDDATAKEKAKFVDMGWQDQFASPFGQDDYSSTGSTTQSIMGPSSRAINGFDPNPIPEQVDWSLGGFPMEMTPSGPHREAGARRYLKAGTVTGRSNGFDYIEEERKNLRRQRPDYQDFHQLEPKDGIKRQKNHNKMFNINHNTVIGIKDNLPFVPANTGYSGIFNGIAGSVHPPPGYQMGNEGGTFPGYSYNV